MPLHEAVRQKDYRLLGRLIRNGANLEEKNEQGDTPLIASARNKFNIGVIILIENGANIEAVNEEGISGLNIYI